MQFSIPRHYDDTCMLTDLINPNDDGTDQYRPQFEEKGQIKCSFGVDPRSGRLTMYVPEILPFELIYPYIRFPKNKLDQPLGRQNMMWRLDGPFPEINAYGQIIRYYYNTVESDA